MDKLPAELKGLKLQDFRGSKPISVGALHKQCGAFQKDIDRDIKKHKEDIKRRKIHNYFETYARLLMDSSESTKEVGVGACLQRDNEVWLSFGSSYSMGSRVDAEGLWWLLNNLPPTEPVSIYRNGWTSFYNESHKFGVEKPKEQEPVSEITVTYEGCTSGRYARVRWWHKLGKYTVQVRVNMCQWNAEKIFGYRAVDSYKSNRDVGRYVDHSRLEMFSIGDSDFEIPEGIRSVNYGRTDLYGKIGNTFVLYTDRGGAFEKDSMLAHLEKHIVKEKEYEKKMKENYE